MIFCSPLSLSREKFKRVDCSTMPRKCFGIVINNMGVEKDHHSKVGIRPTYNDISLAFNLLVKSGIPKERILVVAGPKNKKYDLDGDGRNDIDYNLSVENIRKSFTVASRALRAGGQLAVYIIGHGKREQEVKTGKGKKYYGNSYLQVITSGVWPFENYFFKENLVTPKIFNKWLNNNLRHNKNIELFVFLGNCFAGEFGKCADRNTVVITASDDTHPAYVSEKMEGKDNHNSVFLYFLAKRLQETSDYIKAYKMAAVDVCKHYDDNVSMKGRYIYSICGFNLCTPTLSYDDVRI